MTASAHGQVAAPDERPEPVDSLARLLAHNSTRFAEFRRGRFCGLITDGTLEQAAKRDVFLACVQLFSTRMQTLFFSRQATCRDPRYYATFLTHLKEEIGHDELLLQRQGARQVQDTLLEATLTWFNYQMIVLDNAEKAVVVHLVLETAGDHAHRLMQPVLGRYLESDFMELHAEVDSEHAAMGTPLLGEQHPTTYGRLAGVANEAWDMLFAVTDRIATLVDAAGTELA